MSSPAAWHPDPSGQHEHRYWDGQRWTEHVADGGVASTDPIPDAPTSGERDERTEDRTEDRTEVIGAVDGDTPAAEAPRDAGQQPAWGNDAGQQPAWGDHAASTGPSWATGTGTAPPPSGMATTSLVTGILSLPLLIIFGLGAIAGVVAIVLGIIAVRRVSRGEASGRGLAIGGIVTGAISLILGILIFIALVAFGFGFAGELERCIEETGSQAVCQERLERQLRDRFLES